MFVNSFRQSATLFGRSLNFDFDFPVMKTVSVDGNSPPKEMVDQVRQQGSIFDVYFTYSDLIFKVSMICLFRRSAKFLFVNLFHRSTDLFDRFINFITLCF